jgi:hypothetical protein
LDSFELAFEFAMPVASGATRRSLSVAMLQQPSAAGRVGTRRANKSFRQLPSAQRSEIVTSITLRRGKPEDVPRIRQLVVDER